MGSAGSNDGAMPVTDLTDSYLDAIEAQARLLIVNVDALRAHRHTLKAPAAVRVELPERCQGIAAERCAAQSDDGKVKNFGGTATCQGCREAVA